MAKNPTWFESNAAGEAYACLNKIFAGEFIAQEMYGTALAQAEGVRETMKNADMLSFYYEMESVIIESLCCSIFKGVLKDPMRKEEVKALMDDLKKVQEATSSIRSYCDKFVEELNRLYETYFLKQTKKLQAPPDLLLPLEFASYFFKSLSTLLLKSLGPPKWSKIDVPEGKKLLLETIVEHSRLFKIGSILLLAVHYLRLRIRMIKAQPDEKMDDKFSVIPLSNDEYYSVNLNKKILIIGRMHSMQSKQGVDSRYRGNLRKDKRDRQEATTIICY